MLLSVLTDSPRSTLGIGPEFIGHAFVSDWSSLSVCNGCNVHEDLIPAAFRGDKTKTFLIYPIGYRSSIAHIYYVSNGLTGRGVESSFKLLVLSDPRDVLAILGNQSPQKRIPADKYNTTDLFRMSNRVSC